jgi:hypothetical protein
MNTVQATITNRTFKQEWQYLSPGYRTTASVNWSMPSEGLLKLIDFLEHLPITLIAEKPTKAVNIKGRPQGMAATITTAPVFDNELFCTTGRILNQANSSEPESSEDKEFTLRTSSIYMGSPKTGVFDFNVETSGCDPELGLTSLLNLKDQSKVHLDEIRLGLLFFKTYPAYRFWGENPALIGHLLLEANKTGGFLELRGHGDKKNPRLPELPSGLAAQVADTLKNALGIAILE